LILRDELNKISKLMSLNGNSPKVPIIDNNLINILDG